MSLQVIDKLGLLPSTSFQAPSASLVLTESAQDERKSTITFCSENDDGISLCTAPACRANRLLTCLPQAASEAIAAQPPTELRSGILIVTLHEGRGLSPPRRHENVFKRSVGPPYSGRDLIYAMLDFDNVQLFINATSGTPESPLWTGELTQYKFDVFRITKLEVRLYLRNPTGSCRSQDIFLGVAHIYPRFEEKQSLIEDPKVGKNDLEKAATDFASIERALGQSGTEWLNLQYGTGSIKLGVAYVENRNKSLNIEDFELLKVVGKGSFGKIVQVKKKDTHRIYALKTIRKEHIMFKPEVEHTLAKNSILSQIRNPFINPLKFSFQSAEKIYLVSPFINGGQLFHHLEKEQRFDINLSRFYTAELLYAFECLHSFNVICRDVKPENILLDYSGHIVLCDFGLCKLDVKNEDRTNSFYGTPEYIAPELLLGQKYTKSVDWWILGVLLYEMLTGLPPFYDGNTNEMYRKILRGPLNFPGTDIVPPAAKDLLIKLLDRKPEQRLGALGALEIKAHPLFHGIDWMKLQQRCYEPLFKPDVVDTHDTAGFNSEFIWDKPDDSFTDWHLLPLTVQQQYFGWSYNRPIAGLRDTGDSIKDSSFVKSV